MTEEENLQKLLEIKQLQQNFNKSSLSQPYIITQPEDDDTVAYSTEAVKEDDSFWNKLKKTFINVSMGAASANPVDASVIASAGGSRNRDGSWLFRPESKGAKQLRSNLAVLSTGAYAPMMLGTSVVPTTLRTMGQAMTPSTWLEGVAGAAGYQVPTALSYGADLAASAYFANEAANEINRNGFTPVTVGNALLSIAPFTRDAEAVSAVTNGLRSSARTIGNITTATQKVVNQARLASALNNGVKNTQIINLPIEHVSPKGITEGGALNVGEEGINLSKTGSPVSLEVANHLRLNGQFPFVRSGVLTYSDNMQPVEVQDLGHFSPEVNPNFGNKVAEGNTLFKYKNNWDGKGVGETSYLTMEPSQGLVLSKNVKAPEPFVYDIDRDSPYVKLADDTFALNFDYINNLPKEDKDFVLDQIARKADFIVTPKQARNSPILAKIAKMTGDEQQQFFINNLENSLELMHQRGVNGGYDRLRKNKQDAIEKMVKNKTLVPKIEGPGQTVLDGIPDRDEKLANAIYKFQDAQHNPKYHTDQGFDYTAWRRDLPRDENLLMQVYVKQGLKDNLPVLLTDLSPVGIQKAYHSPINIDSKYNYNAVADFVTRSFTSGEDLLIFNPIVKAHETNHLLVRPSKSIPDDAVTTPDQYLHRNGAGVESAARYSQLLNWYGYTDGKYPLISPAEWDFARKILYLD